MKITATEPAPLKCPKCRHTWVPRPPRVRRFRVSSSRPKPKPAPVVDLASLSTADLFKHYKQTAPLEDVRFFVKHARMSPGLRFAAEVLEASIVELRITDRKTIYRELTMLQDFWRLESNARDYARRLLERYAFPIPIDRQLAPAPADLEVAA